MYPRAFSPHQVSGPRRDLHSGNEGGVFNEPLADLTKLLATCIDSHSNILIPGFYDDVKPNLLDPSKPGLANTLEFSVDKYQEQVGVPAISAGDSVVEVLAHRWCHPSLSVVDVKVMVEDTWWPRWGVTKEGSGWVLRGCRSLGVEYYGGYLWLRHRGLFI